MAKGGEGATSDDMKLSAAGYLYMMAMSDSYEYAWLHPPGLSRGGLRMMVFSLIHLIAPILFLPSALALLARVSFEGLQELSMGDVSIFLHAAQMKIRSLGSFRRLLAAGDNGLRALWDDSCQFWNRELFYTVRQLVGNDVPSQRLLLSQRCINNLQRVGWWDVASSERNLLGTYPRRGSNGKALANGFKRLEALDPSGRWYWDFYTSAEDNPLTYLQQHLHLMESRFLELALLDIIDESLTTNSIPLALLDHFCLRSRRNAHNPKIVSYAVYGIIRVALAEPEWAPACKDAMRTIGKPPGLGRIGELTVEAFLQDAPPPGPWESAEDLPFGMVAAQTCLFLARPTPFDETIGERLVAEWRERLAPRWDDVQMEHFLRTILMLPCTGLILGALLTRPVRARLMQIPPPRLDLTAVLMQSQDSTAYFRRWLAFYTEGSEWSVLFSDPDPTLMLRRVRVLPYDCIPPRYVWGKPLLSELEMVLDELITKRPTPFQIETTDAGIRMITWGMARWPNTKSLGWTRLCLLVHLVILAKLHFPTCAVDLAPRHARWAIQHVPMEDGMQTAFFIAFPSLLFPHC